MDSKPVAFGVRRVNLMSIERPTMALCDTQMDLRNTIFYAWNSNFVVELECIQSNERYLK